MPGPAAPNSSPQTGRTSWSGTYGPHHGREAARGRCDPVNDREAVPMAVWTPRGAARRFFYERGETGWSSPRLDQLSAWRAGIGLAITIAASINYGGSVSGLVGDA